MTSDNRVFLLVQFKSTRMSHKFKEEVQNSARRLCSLTPNMMLLLDYSAQCHSDSGRLFLSLDVRSREKLTVRVLNPIYFA